MWWRLLPDRKDLFASFSDASREYLVNLTIRPGCRLAGQDIEAASLRHLHGLFLFETRRQQEAITPVPPHQILREEDELTFAGARQSIDWQTLVTLVAAFWLGKAMDNAGLVSMGASLTVETFGGVGPWAVLAGVYLMTSLCTELITNNAAAALIFPFAVNIAIQLGVSPRPFALAVAFAASASLMTPLGYQTNLMVYGPGGYRFTDYLRIGIPLNLILLMAATLLIPRGWPF
jgi:di/tricarboxylate transporter